MSDGEPLVPSQPRTDRAGRLWRLCQKELRETLRDRRTILTLVLMPILVYPLLSILFQKFLLTNAPRVREVIIGVESPEAESELEAALLNGDRLVEQARRQFSDDRMRPYIIAQSKPAVRQLRVVEDLEEEVRKGVRIDIGVRLAQHPRAGRPRPGLKPRTFVLLFRESSPIAQDNLQYVEARLTAINVLTLAQRLNEDGSRTRFPAVMARQPIESKAESIGSLGTLVPLILILMTITGAVYPAIDLTAGERERGTLETLIAAPTPRLSILFAKYIAVLTVASMTAAINLAAMTTTALTTGMGELLFGSAGLSVLTIFQVFLLMLLFAGFFSAVLLALTSLARSFKEAQAYTIPLMLMAITPGVISLFPGVTMNGTLSVTPLINIVLLARDVFAGKAVFFYAVAAVISTLLYAAAALGIAARIFGTDAVLYGSSGTWSDLVRRPPEASETPLVSQALFCLAAIFPCYFVASNVLGQLDVSYLDDVQALNLRMALSAVALMAVFGGVPLLACFKQRLRLRTTLRIQPVALLGVVGAALLGVSLWPAAYELVLWYHQLLVGEMPAERLAEAERLASLLPQSSLFVVITSLALAPAVFEELFFRGYMFSALQKKYSPLRAIVISGVVFGFFHVLVVNRLAMERLVPTTLLGFVLGWVAYRTGSVVASMLLHAIHNAILMSLAYFREDLGRVLGWDAEQGHLPWWLVASGLAAAVVGALIVFRLKPHQPGNAQAETVA